MVKSISTRELHNQPINMRATQQQRDLIDQAALALGKSRSEFVLETACREAEEILLDRTFFRLESDVFDRFVAALDNPPAPSDELRALLHSGAPWE